MLSKAQLKDLSFQPAKDEPGTVNIVIYKGTVYGVYHYYEDARAFAEAKFGESAMMALSVSILRQKVE